MIPKYPRRLSVNRGLATSFRHSIWPKWAGDPSMWMYSSFAILLCRAYTSSSLNEARMAADSCWMRARSSATVCKGLRWLQDREFERSTLQALIPLIRAVWMLQSKVPSYASEPLTLEIMVHHGCAFKAKSDSSILDMWRDFCDCDVTPRFENAIPTFFDTRFKYQQ